MSFMKLALAAAVALSTSAAMAEDISTNVNLTPGPVSGEFSGAFGDTHSWSGAFTDVFTFSPPVGSSLVGGSLVTFDFPMTASHDINFVSADLNGIAFTLSPNGTFETGTVSGVTSGTLVLTVHGIAGGTLDRTPIDASYSGTINVDPVPEPATVSMLLAGIGALGFIARRRRQQG
jgi:hypothetical protein